MHMNARKNSFSSVENWKIGRYSCASGTQINTVNYAVCWDLGRANVESDVLEYLFLNFLHCKEFLNKILKPDIKYKLF
jgi:hypothetical protein